MKERNGPDSDPAALALRLLTLTMRAATPRMNFILYMRISRVYTKAGDGGETALVGGRRVSKASLRVDAYGEVDELNSVIGLARVRRKTGRLTTRSASFRTTYSP